MLRRLRECQTTLLDHVTLCVILRCMSAFKDLSEYIFDRKEMARLIGISPNALRMRIRNGNKDGLEFAVIKGKVFFGKGIGGPC